MQRDSNERRSFPRRTVNIAAMLVGDGGVMRLPATIRNVSPGGAMIELPEIADIPRDMYLLLPKHRLQPCRMVWRLGRAMGVSYITALSAAD